MPKINEKSRLQIIVYSISSAIRNRGFLKTIQMIAIALVDQAQDRRRGLLAHDFVDSSAVTQGHPSAHFANFYQPVRSIPFLKMLNILQPDLSSNFIDIGSGAGKALILARDFGFKKVVGVELVPQLCTTAKINQAKLAISPETFDIICGDALSYDLQANDRFIFMNDPFSEEVFAPFLEKVLAMSQQGHLPITLVYKNNNRRTIPSFLQLANKFEFQEIDIWGNLFQIVIIRNK